MLPQFLRPKQSFLARFLTARALEGTLSAQELEEEFQKERARSDRSGNAFSMVVFRVEDGHLDELAPLVSYARDRMRIYDSVGVLDSSRVGFVLPETAPAGAWVFAEDCLDQLHDAQAAQEDSKPAKKHSKVSCEVFGYPLDWQKNTPEGDSDLDRPAPPIGTSARAAGAVSTQAMHAMHVDPSASRERQGEDAKPVGDFSSAFLEPLPWTKRVVDVAVSGTALLLLSPVYLTAAALVKLTSPGPIIFRQQRAGRGGVPFTFYKFRSMYVDAEARRKALETDNDHKEGPIFKMRDDPRITPVGRILRRLSIDELPQLYNVLIGDMTLIGPRPPTLNEVAEYEPWQRKRLDITGGLTCIWQVSGRSEVGFEEWVRMDIEYQRKRSLLFDIRLILKTFGAVLSGRGAY